MFEQRFTERGREVLKLALTEASHFNHDHIDPAHLLVGLLREERGVAAQATERGPKCSIRVAEGNLQIILKYDPPT